MRTLSLLVLPLLLVASSCGSSKGGSCTGGSGSTCTDFGAETNGDENAALCTALNGSGFGNSTFSSDACPTGSRVGSCASGTSTFRYYSTGSSPHTSTTAQSACTTSGGTYTDG
jgi:hypothetical protein